MSTVAEAWVQEAKAQGRVEGKAEGRVQGKAEGKVEGKAEGRVEGKAETLLRLMQRRFAVVPESARARVAVGSAAEIDAWLDALLDAQSVTEIFDTPH